jgi:hypothetical protein
MSDDLPPLESQSADGGRMGFAASFLVIENARGVARGSGVGLDGR